MSDYAYFQKELDSRPTRNEHRAMVHEYFRNVLNLAANKIIPAWQKDPPKMDMNEEWVWFGFSNRKSINPVTRYVGDILNTERWVEYTVKTVFYGEECENHASMLRDSFIHPDNQAFFNKNNTIAIKIQDIITLPELVDDKWVNRCDFAFVLRFKETNRFNLPSVLSAETLIERA